MKIGKENSGLRIMQSLFILVMPLIKIMILAIVFGVLGFLCAIFINIVAAYILLKIMGYNSFAQVPLSYLLLSLLAMALARGILHYGEQYCNHYIAFRILAMIRHKVFACLCKLCPAKLVGQEKGNLITLITSDIELLEVFFAHTISPIAIALITSIIMLFFFAKQHFLAFLIALFAYLVIGIVLPIWNRKKGSDTAIKLRTQVADLNNFVLDSMYGLDEILQYKQGQARLDMMNQKAYALYEKQKKLSSLEAKQRALTNLLIQIFSCFMLFIMLYLYQIKEIGFSQMLISTLAMMSSFGPCVALASLSNSLNQTLACAKRILSLLSEKPLVNDVFFAKPTEFKGLDIENVSFKYAEENVLKDVSLHLPLQKVFGIYGASGSGKSTLLRLIMRFWDVNNGCIKISQKNIKKINTNDLRKFTSYVTQDTIIFHDTIAKNIMISKPDATIDEVKKAAKQANIHEFIMQLPKGYATNVGELGDILSDGEKQRIGLARAFLHNSELLLLDEPTSNLDILNEGIILKSLVNERKNKTIILVSHKKSTLAWADELYEMKNGRIS